MNPSDHIMLIVYYIRRYSMYIYHTLYTILCIEGGCWGPHEVSWALHLLLLRFPFRETNFGVDVQKAKKAGPI